MGTIFIMEADCPNCNEKLQEENLKVLTSNGDKIKILFCNGCKDEFVYPEDVFEMDHACDLTEREVKHNNDQYIFNYCDLHGYYSLK